MRPRLRSIRFKVIAAALGASALVAIVFMPFASEQLDRGFDQFEIDYVTQERARLQRVLQDRAARLGRTAIDYSRWNDTVEYVAGSRPQWPDDNLSPDVFANFNVAAIVVADRESRVLTARGADGTLSAAAAARLLEGATCADAMRLRDFRWRFTWLPDGPHIVACSPIMLTDATSTPVGSMTWSVRLDADRITEMQGLVQFPFRFRPPAGELPADQYSEGSIVASMPVLDSDGKPGLVATFDLPRPLGAQRQLTTRTLLQLIVAALCIPPLLMLVFLEKFVVRRLREVSRWVRSARGQTDLTAAAVASPPIDVGFAELEMLTHDFAALIREMEDARAQWQSEALHDSLTGLGNRTLLLAEMAPWLDQRLPLALMLVDLDGFKAVNDLLGHPAGDVVLRDVGGTLRDLAPAEVSVYRLGGDEFALLWPNFTPGKLAPLAQALCDGVRLVRYAEGKPLSVTTCVGVGVSHPDEPLDASNLLAHADLALYDAKRAGRAQHREFSASVHANYRDNLALSSALTAALNESRLTAWFQPVVNADGHAPIALEALARWHEPGRGWIPPVRFIAVAEHEGQILELDLAVMRFACAAFSAFTDLCPGLALHLNVSARTLADPRFVQYFDAMLAATGVAGTCLCLEITESDLNTPAQELEPGLQALASRGVRLAVDDFGVGASSLGRVSQIAPHALKIDGSFVRDLEGKGGRICRAIVELSRELGMLTVAEYVERDEQAATLLQMGCNALQGYGISAPLPGDEMLEWLRSRVARPRPQ